MDFAARAVNEPPDPTPRRNAGANVRGTAGGVTVVDLGAEAVDLAGFGGGAWGDGDAVLEESFAGGGDAEEASEETCGDAMTGANDGDTAAAGTETRLVSSPLVLADTLASVLACTLVLALIFIVAPVATADASFVPCATASAAGSAAGGRFIAHE